LVLLTLQTDSIMYFLSWYKKYQKNQGCWKFPEIIFASREKNSSRFAGFKQLFPYCICSNNFRAEIFRGRI